MEILVITVWVAVVVGYSEGAFWWITSHFFGSLIYMHPGYFWMSPVAQIALFTLPGLFLAMIAWRAKDWDVATFAVTIMSFAGWFNLLLLVPGLHNEARILAAAGLAAATGRFFRRRRSACLRLFRRTMPWLLASILALPFVYQLEEAERETSCMASLPASPRDGPNILFMVLDTVRADALERYGRDASIAPNLTQLAEKGVVFEQALANASWTLPSMASIFTGRLPHEFSADWMSPLEDEHPTIAEALSARGWLTGGFVGNTRYCSRETGLARGYAHYEGYRLTLVDFALSTGLGRMVLFGELPIRFGWLDWPGRKRAAEINGGFLQWLDRNEDRPFFAFLNYWDAHDPYIAPESFRNHWPANDLEEKLMRYWWWISKDPVTDQQIAMLKGAYEDCIRALDHEIGKLLNQLNHRGLLDNTIIIVTADHGEHFGEHDLLLHGNSLYEPLLHVPLVVTCPGKVPSGIRVREPVALNGLPNTLLEMLGTDKNFPGTSWVRHWSGGNRPEAPPEIIVSELASQAGFPPCHGRSPICRHGSMRCLREGHLKYIRADDLEEELYDLAEDSTEEKNLINDPRYVRDLERMRSHFRRLVERRGERRGQLLTLDK